jgi:CHAT domain-containing protein
LARAFLYAGAHSLLVLHWVVDDKATTRLTTDLFTRLSKNSSLSRAEALQQSMLMLINNPAEPVEAFPGLWAPLVVVGNGR